uniref:CUB domain-containing protein n=1 Tax=Macrostomum lignano TaxID=282301 RepID=A0A1I8GJ89_9PLAT
DKNSMKSQQRLSVIPLLVAIWSSAVVRAYPIEQVESRPIDGHKFVEGQRFRFACRATGNSELALRMICPLTDHAPGDIVSDACFENCGKPLCNQPGLHDCSANMPELSDAGCIRTVSQLSDGSQEIHIENQGHGEVGTSATARPWDNEKHQLKSGWFYNSLVGKLAGIDLVLILLLTVLGVVLLSGFLFIRCQVAAAGRASRDTETPKRPLHQCCTKMLCINMDNSGGPAKSNGYPNRKQAPANYNQQRQQKQQQRLVKAPAIQPFSNGSDTASGQVYSEANLDSSYYSQGEASDGRDADYRLQTHFDAADSRVYPMVSGSQRGPRGGGGGSFFNRDAPDRHSFHNVRASRQRPAIPVDLLMRGNGAESGGGGGAQLSREEIQEQVEKQRREIDNLRQLLRDSQQQLSRLASSQQELHRSVSVTKMPTAASAATTPDDAPMGIHPMEAQGEYELLTRASSANPPTVQASSGDLLQLAIEQPIKEEEVDEEPYVTESQESVQYPTVKTAQKRRSSIGEALEFPSARIPHRKLGHHKFGLNEMEETRWSGRRKSRDSDRQVKTSRRATADRSATARAAASAAAVAAVRTAMKSRGDDGRHPSGDAGGEGADAAGVYQLVSQKSLFRSFARSTATHGVNHLTDESSGRSRQLLWSCFLIAAGLGLLLHFSQLIARYAEYQVNTEIVQEAAEFEMPDITFCPNDYASRYYSNEVNITNRYGAWRTLNDIPYDIARVWHLLKNWTTDMPLYPYSSYWDARLSLKQIAYRSESFAPMHEALIYCRFNGAPCSYRNFTLYKDNTLFLCFTFQPDTRRLVRSGPSGGLSLVLYNSADSFLTEQEQLFHLPAFLASVHPPGTAADFEKSAFTAPLGHITMASLWMQSSYKAGCAQPVARRSQPCVPQRHPVSYVMDYSSPKPSVRQFRGNRDDCLLLARHKEFLRDCGCVADHLLIPEEVLQSGLGLCHQLDDEVFFRDIFFGIGDKLFYTIRNISSGKYGRLDDFLFGDRREKFLASQRNIHCFYRVKKRQETVGIDESICLSECEQRKYSFSAVSYSWPGNRTESPSKAMRKYILQQIRELHDRGLETPALSLALRNLNSELGTSYAVLQVFPAELRGVAYKEDFAYPLKNLFSDFGGILGLWSGISVITCVEFVEYIVLALRLLRRRIHGDVRGGQVEQKSHLSNYPSTTTLSSYLSDSGSYNTVYPTARSQRAESLADGPLVQNIQHEDAWVHRLFGI